MVWRLQQLNLVGKVTKAQVLSVFHTEVRGYSHVRSMKSLLTHKTPDIALLTVDGRLNGSLQFARERSRATDLPRAENKIDGRFWPRLQEVDNFVSQHMPQRSEKGMSDDSMIELSATIRLVPFSCSCDIHAS